MKKSIGLNRTTLKYIAAFAMFIDHIGMFLIPITTPLGVLFRIVGRLTAPIMCLFLAEGFAHTSSREKYAVRLFVFAFISQLAYAFSHYRNLLVLDFNMIFTLFLSFLMLTLIESEQPVISKWLMIIFLYLLSFLGDWGGIAPLWVVLFYRFRKSVNKRAIAFSVVAFFMVFMSAISCVMRGANWYLELWQAGLFLFLPFLYYYNGKSGQVSPFHKWFFYIFYPLHLIVLGLL